MGIGKSVFRRSSLPQRLNPAIGPHFNPRLLRSAHHHFTIRPRPLDGGSFGKQTGLWKNGHPQRLLWDAVEPRKTLSGDLTRKLISITSQSTIRNPVRTEERPFLFLQVRLYRFPKRTAPRGVNTSLEEGHPFGFKNISMRNMFTHSHI